MKIPKEIYWQDEWWIFQHYSGMEDAAFYSSKNLLVKFSMEFLLNYKRYHDEQFNKKINGILSEN